jgi:hypothetical protein
MGHAFGPNTERGVFRTTGGGRNWAKVSYADDRTCATDRCFAPANPNIVLAAMDQAERQPWSFTGGGLYRSTDAGATGKHLEGKGLPNPGQAPEHFTTSNTEGGSGANVVLLVDITPRRGRRSRSRAVQRRRTASRGRFCCGPDASVQGPSAFCTGPLPVLKP